MTKTEKARQLLDKINALEKKKSLSVQSEITNLTEKLKDNFVVKTLKSMEKIGTEVEKLKSDFNLKPIMDAVRQLEKEISQSEQSLRQEFTDQLRAIPQAPDLTEEVIALQKQFDNKLQALGVEDAKKDIENFKVQLQTYIDSDIEEEKTEKEELDKKLSSFRNDINTRLNNLGGGQAAPRTQINSSIMSSRYIDVNYLGSITKADNNTTKQVDITFAGGASIGGAITGGTAGSVLFVNPAGIIAQDNTNFFWDDTNNRLGLGINSPATTLDVLGAHVSNIGVAQFKGTGQFGFVSLDNSDVNNGLSGFVFKSNGVKTAQIDSNKSNGDVSIYNSIFSTSVPVIKIASATGLTTLSNGLTITGHLLNATSNTFDIGASGATTFRTLYLGTSLDVGGSKGIIGANGTITKYNNISTVSNGVPSELATIDSTGLTANVGATTLYVVPASGSGMYRVSAYLVTTTAASVSSTMPNAQVVFTDNDSNTSVTLDISPILGAAGLGQSGLLTANTVGTVFSGSIPIYVKASTTIQYQTINYASTIAGMAYSLRIKLEAM